MAKSKRPLELEDFLRNRILGQLKVDASERYAAYLETTAELQPNRWTRHLRLVDLKDLSHRRVDTPGAIEDFSWASDEDSLLYGKAFSEKGSRFFSYRADEGSFRDELEISFRAFDFTFHQEQLFFTAKIRDTESTDSVACSETLPLFEDGAAGPGAGVTGLFRCDHHGRSLELITPPDMDLDLLEFDLPRSRILFSAFSLSDPRNRGIRPTVAHLYAYDLDSGKLSLLWDTPYRISGIAGVDEELVLFFGVDMDVQYRNDNPNLYFCRPRSATCTPLEPYPDLSNEHPGVVTDSFFTSAPIMVVRQGRLHFKVVGRNREYLASLDIAAAEEATINPAASPVPVTVSEGVARPELVDTGLTIIGSFVPLSLGTLLIGLRDLGLSELFILREGRTEQLGSHNGWLEDIHLSRPHAFRELIDGVEVDGYLYPPLQKSAAGTDPADAPAPGTTPTPGAASAPGSTTAPGTRTGSPAVLMIHGGPKMIYAPVFAHDIQLLCTRGYHVFCANPSGSDGRGNRFLDIRGNFGELPYRQLMEITDRVLKRFPDIDPQRLGVSGGSYGGYMTNYIITRTDRFAAAVSERSISNLLTSYLSTDIGYHFGREYIGRGSDPWQELVKGELSPIHRAHRAVTPTLFIHGMNDYRCQPSESVNMYSALKIHGVESRIALFEGESHGLVVRGRPQSKLRRYREFLSWFDRFLGDGGRGDVPGESEDEAK